MTIDVSKYNALSLAQPTNFAGMLRSGEVLFGTALTIPHEDAARAVASMPYAFCFIDAEHTPWGPDVLASAVKTLQWSSGGKMVPVVRVPGHTPSMIAYAFDAGAGGVIMPHVQTPAQAREFVRMAKFPPFGGRSYPPLALLPGAQMATPEGKTIFDIWNEHGVVICQIEDKEGVENVEEIAAVPGVGALMVGPVDLRFSLGLPAGSQDGEEPEFVAALDKVHAAARKHNLPILGFVFSPDLLAKRIEKGWTAFVTHADVLGIVMSGQMGLQAMQAAVEDIKQPKVLKNGTNGYMED